MSNVHLPIKKGLQANVTLPGAYNDQSLRITTDTHRLYHEHLGVVRRVTTIPTGGAINNVLAKNTADNFDLAWKGPFQAKNSGILKTLGVVAAPNNTWTDIPYHITYEYDDSFMTLQPNGWEIKVDGTYMVVWNLGLQSSITGESYVDARIANSRTGDFAHLTIKGHRLQVTGVSKCNVGDMITTRVLQLTGSSKNIVDDGRSSSTLTCVRIGG